MKFIKNFIQHYKNARLCVEQIKNGEWKLSPPNMFDGEIYTAKRNNQYLWITNESFFVDIKEGIFGKYENYFGYFWRHYVWWFGVKKYLLKNEVPILE